MIFGKPPTDDEQPSVTDSSGETPEEADGTDGGNNNDTSTVSRLLDTARKVSDIVSPFAGLATALVNAITAYKFIKEVA